MLGKLCVKQVIFALLKTEKYLEISSNLTKFTFGFPANN